MTNMEILETLEKGDIFVSRSLSLLKNINKRKSSIGKSRWFRIQIKNEKHNFKLYIPISLVIFVLYIGKLLMTNANKNVKYNEDIKRTQDIFANIDNKDIKRLIKVLKHSGKINIVEVKDGENSVIIGTV